MGLHSTQGVHTAHEGMWPTGLRAKMVATTPDCRGAVLRRNGMVGLCVAGECYSAVECWLTSF